MTGAERPLDGSRVERIRPTLAAEPSTAVVRHGNTRKVLDSAPFHPRGHREGACTTTRRRTDAAPSDPAPDDRESPRGRAASDRARHRRATSPIRPSSGVCPFLRGGRRRRRRSDRPIEHPDPANRCAAHARAGPAVAPTAGARLPDERPRQLPALPARVDGRRRARRSESRATSRLGVTPATAGALALFAAGLRRCRSGSWSPTAAWS